MKKAYLFIFGLLLFGNAEILAQVNLIQNVSARKTVILDGVWDSQVDVVGVGSLARFGLIQDRKPTKFTYNGDNPRNTELVEQDMDVAEKINVPGDWNTQKEKLFLYEGNLWYRKKFAVIPQVNKRYFLYFGAVNYEATVYLNGIKLGQHKGGFTPFQFEITKELKSGENKLLVNANNTRGEDNIPTKIADWWNYGGITRSVYLVEEPETFIADYFIQLEKGKLSEIKGWVKMSGSQKAQAVNVEIPELGLKQSVQTDTTGYAVINFSSKKIQHWTPQTPKLYDVTISSANDNVKDKIGFRTIETRGTEILLNGKPIFLKGAAIHEEAPFRTGRCYSEGDARTLLTWAKELGSNYIRLAHYPHNEVMTRMADEMGLLVWSEVPIYWNVKFEKPEVYANAENQLLENISRDKNRASIILWSVANETNESEPRLQFLKKLLEKTKSIDPTRLTTAALLPKEGKGEFSLDDPLGEFVDVMGCNEYIGWYTLPAELASSIKWTSKYQKPLIISEFGAEAVAGLHGKPDEIWTEEYQNRIFENQVKMLNSISFLQGTSVWVLMDFRSPLRLLPIKQDFFNRKGIVSEKGIKKMAFYTLKTWYETK
ncbi:MAG: glycoside hydrolase family 2 protein [Flectobacillus sp.]|uniref:glycoside hydrolase family 2 protein n=1 Tax=Flectobacillus sp. TaxID=50419 RepID=UPI003B9920E1